MKSTFKYLSVMLLFAMTASAAHADSYKGTLTRQGTKMEYSFSGGVVTDKNYKTRGTIAMYVYVDGEVKAGSTVSGTFKKITDYGKSNQDVTVEIKARTSDGGTLYLKDSNGKDSATASAKVPDDATEVTISMGFTGRMGPFGCVVTWNVVNKKSSTPKTPQTPTPGYDPFSQSGNDSGFDVSISGGEYRNKNMSKMILHQGNTINMSISYRLDGDVKTYCFINNNGKVVKKAAGGKSASLSYTIPADMTGTIKANFFYETDKLGKTPLYSFQWKIVKNSNNTENKTQNKSTSTTPNKSINWDDVSGDDRCPLCHGQFSCYYVSWNLQGDVYAYCNSDPKNSVRPLEGGLDPIYYNDYIGTGSQSEVLLDYKNERDVLLIKENSLVHLVKRNANGSDRWDLHKGRIVGKGLKHAGEPEFHMSQCVAKPTGTTYMLVDDGKTSRVYLLEGDMEVTSNKGSKKQNLKPGQVVTVSSNGKMKTQKFDVAAAAKKYGITLSGDTPNNDKKPEKKKDNDVINDTGKKVKKCKIKGVEFSMVKVEGGTFTMGATREQGSNNSNQQPTHKVTLSTYYIGETEVTQELWQAVMGNNPSHFKGAKLPVENVSWNECQQFISKINKLTGRKFRLPTEAEWEFAARGGKAGKGYKYSGSNNADAVAWHEGNSNNTTHKVGTKAANELGIYDMSGNVWEWCQDWFGDYSTTAQTNPKGASSGTDRLNRGGGWCHEAKFATVFYRGTSGKPDRKVDNLGFRLVLEP